MPQENKVELNKEETELQSAIKRAFRDEYKDKVIADAGNMQKFLYKLEETTADKLREKLRTPKDLVMPATVAVLWLVVSPMSFVIALSAGMVFSVVLSINEQSINDKVDARIEADKDKLPARYVEEILPKQKELAAGLTQKFTDSKSGVQAPANANSVVNAQKHNL